MKLAFFAESVNIICLFLLLSEKGFHTVCLAVFNIPFEFINLISNLFQTS